MKKRFFCLILSFYLIFSNLFITYDTAYATGLDAVAGWEAAVAGVGGTLLLPFGQVAFLLFSLFGVTIAVNDGETIKEAGQDMWDDFTEWYENTFIPGLDAAHEKKEQMMQELANWEEKAENGVFSKVSQVWDALKEFAKFIKSKLVGDEVIHSKGVTYRGEQSFVSSNTRIELVGNIQGIATGHYSSSSSLIVRNHCMIIDKTQVWGGHYYWEGEKIVDKVAMVYQKIICSNEVRIYYAFICAEPMYISWRDLDYSDSTSSNSYTGNETMTNGLNYVWNFDSVNPKDGGDISDLALDGITALPTQVVSEWTESNFKQNLADFFKTGLSDEEEVTATLPGVLGRDWNTVAGQDKANVNESDEAIVLTGEGIRSKEKSKEKEQEAETEMEGVLGKVSDTSKSKENTAEQAKAVEEAYQKTGVKGVSDEEEVAKEISKSVNFPSSENSEYQLKGLEKVFPFCIPFDIYDFINCLSASPKAPKFTYKFYTKKDGKKGYDNIEIDLSAFDDLAEFLRLCELLLFIVGLAFVTRSHYVK